MDEFYVQNKATWARSSACKECVKAGVRANRLRHLDYYVAYDAKRYQERPERREHATKCFEKWRRTPRGKAVIRARKVVQADRYSARHAVLSAVRDGRLKKLPCEVCGDPKVHGHHDDYSKPLDVRWLCATHHAEHHRVHGKSPRQEVAKTVPR